MNRILEVANALAEGREAYENIMGLDGCISFGVDEIYYPGRDEKT